MRVYQPAVFAILALTLAATPSKAQDAPRAVVTPFVAMGTDGASPVSAAIMFPITSAVSVETDVAYRRGEDNIHATSTNASLLVSLPHVGRFTPYGAAGVGLARYGELAIFQRISGERELGTMSRLAGTVNFGGGIKTRLTDRVDFRTDVRWFQSSGRQQGDQFRVALGVGVNIGKR